MKQYSLWIFLGAALLAGCSSLTAGKHKNGGGSPTDTRAAALTPAKEGVIDETADATDDEADDDTEPVEETDQDLGDVSVSTKLSQQEIEADTLALKTFPLVDNEFVQQWVKYFTGRGRKTFERYLARSTRYIPLMKDVLRDDGLPEDLIYLSMIESGFNPKARSKAKAVGPWQFIKGTGSRYDLDMNYWVDQRRDFVKATHAAATYLKELHQIFGSWYLAAASYNAGEGKVLQAIRREKTRNFWELARKKPKTKEKSQNFRAETRNYVPKMIAAALISKHPEKYGFSDIEYEEPFDWVMVHVPGGVDMRSVAEIMGYDEERLHILNAELVRGITPPGEAGYDLKIPRALKDTLVSKLGELKPSKIKDFAIHTVRKGDTLGGIARRYGSDVQEILDLNHLKSTRSMRVGMELSVPVRRNERNSERRTNASRNKNAVKSSTSKTPATTTVSADPVVAANGSYTVQDGDTFWDIAKKHGLTVQELTRANPNLRPRSLRAGLTVKIPEKKL